MVHRTLLERLLATLVGAFLGAILSTTLLLLWLGWHWALLILPAMGGAIGFLAGDPGIRALMRTGAWFP